MKQFICLIACACSILGCNKDNSNDPKPETLKYVQKIVKIEDGNEIDYIFNYSNENRLMGYVSEEDAVSATFQYASNGQLTAIRSEEEGVIHKLEVTYETNGDPKQATLTSHPKEEPEEEEVTQITYQMNQGRVSRIRYVQPDDEIIDFNLSYQGNNLVKIEGINSSGSVSITSKYGNRKSAFYASRQKYILLPDLMFDLYSENELLESTLAIPDIAAITMKYAHQYNEQSYPTQIEEVNEESEIESKMTITYK